MRNLIEVAQANRLTKCSNCGQQLTIENLARALMDAGLDPNAVETRESATEIDRLMLCCPTYSEERGCLGYSSEDKEKAAYWYSR